MIKVVIEKHFLFYWTLICIGFHFFTCDPKAGVQYLALKNIKTIKNVSFEMGCVFVFLEYKK